jgi:hypothetical protein
MSWTNRCGALVLTVAAAVALVAAGCGKTGTKTEPAKNAGGQAKGQTTPSEEKVAQAGEKKDKGHEGWWCAEHGVPEEMCSLCNDAVAAKLKKAGDWCKEQAVVRGPGRRGGAGPGEFRPGPESRPGDEDHHPEHALPGLR